MTPQQLMDLPSAGMAEKQLRNDGLWRDFTPQEHLETAIEALDDMLNELLKEKPSIGSIMIFSYQADQSINDALDAMEATCN